FGRHALRTSLHGEGFLRTGEAGKKIEHRGVAGHTRWAEQAELHGAATGIGGVSIKALDAAKATVFGQCFRFHQYVTTLRIDSPACIRSKASLMRSSGMVCVMRSSTLILPSIYHSTMRGTSVRPRAPPKAVP